MTHMKQSELIDLLVSRPQGYAWFLGAGASRMSGLPTATDIIWDLKTRFYCREENQELSRQDLPSPAVKARIQAFMDSRGVPPLWADQEYSTYFDKIFGDDKERQRAYLQAILAEDRVTLTIGNRVLGAMLSLGLSRIAFTTNFDSVVEHAVADVSGRSLSAYHLEGSTAANQALRNEEFPLYCKLHGDFRYDSVKNLTEDLVQQDRELAACMVAAASRFGFVSVGYSGRDDSVMALFRAALATGNAFPHGLYWTTVGSGPVLPAVSRLIEDAQAAGVAAALVEIETFDALMLKLWRNLPGKPAEIDSKVRKTLPATVNISLPTQAPAPRYCARTRYRLPPCRAKR
ncbi:SIR2 family protein [Sphingomonas sp.]|uniref:SIR2 family protein n=1 Tax=Sphingomonas sp. TaxID=28214 RepID=UPI003D6D6272